jgi:hypothetical protein
VKGATTFDVVQSSEAPLRALASRSKTRIEMESTNLHKTLLATRKR